MANLEGEAGTSESVSQCSRPGESQSGSRRSEDFFVFYFSDNFAQLDFRGSAVTRIPRVYESVFRWSWFGCRCGGNFLGKLTLYITIWIRQMSCVGVVGPLSSVCSSAIFRNRDLRLHNKLHCRISRVLFVGTCMAAHSKELN